MSGIHPKLYIRWGRQGIHWKGHGIWSLRPGSVTYRPVVVFFFFFMYKTLITDIPTLPTSSFHLLTCAFGG